MSIKGPKVEPNLLDRVLNRPTPLHEELALVAGLRTDLSVAEHNTIVAASLMLKAYARGADAKDAAFWRWLRDNAGKWSVSPDPLSWKDNEGREFHPKVAFTSHDTAYFGLTLEEAVALAMKRPN